MRCRGFYCVRRACEQVFGWLQHAVYTVGHRRVERLAYPASEPRGIGAADQSQPKIYPSTSSQYLLTRTRFIVKGTKKVVLKKKFLWLQLQYKASSSDLLGPRIVPRSPALKGLSYGGPTSSPADARGRRYRLGAARLVLRPWRLQRSQLHGLRMREWAVPVRRRLERSSLRDAILQHAPRLQRAR
jgi:hypothetical protein